MPDVVVVTHRDAKYPDRVWFYIKSVSGRPIMGTTRSEDDAKKWAESCGFTVVGRSTEWQDVMGVIHVKEVRNIP